MMKLLVADDHILFRDALVQYIERAEQEIAVSVAHDLRGVINAVEEGLVPDLILLDLRMPGMHGLQGIQKVHERAPAVPVVLMSGSAEKADVERALEMGVRGYFPKTMSGKAMMNAIKDVVAGQPYVPMDHNTDDILPSYYHSYDGSGVGPAKAGVNGAEIKLTPREKEVLLYLLQGQANKEIARALDLQVVTVKLHVRGICRKLGAKNRTQAALMATDMGLAKAVNS